MDRIRIGDRWVGPGEPCFVIAEVGSNHDGSLEHACDYIDLAADLGADAVKFQSFSAASLVNQRWPNGGGGTMATPFLSTLSRLELPLAWHARLLERAQSRGLVFLATAFDEERVDFLASLGVAAFKVASGDLTHEPLLSRVGSYRRPVILSTGLATLEEIERAVWVLETAAGWTERASAPVILLHCVSSYPARPESLNLRSLGTLRERFALPVGFSDHSESATLPVVAVALGACVIEKHLTFSKQTAGPDHAFALTPREFREMVRNIREAEASLGEPVKGPQEEEMSERVFARRGLFAACDIPQGTRLAREMIKIVRPCLGLEPGKLEWVVGKVAGREIRADEPIEASMLSEAGQA